MSDCRLLEQTWRERTVRANGVDFHVVEAGEVGAPLLILLHGFPEFWWAWRRQLTPLAEAGFHVVAPDLRGFNLSGAPRGISSYGLDILAADVTELASALGAARFRLVGHDWGAVIAWNVASQHPGRVEGIVCIGGPHPKAWLSQVLKSPRQALLSAYVAFFQLPWLPEAVLGARKFAWLKAAMRRSARNASVEPGMFGPYLRSWARAGSLTCMLNYYRALLRWQVNFGNERIKSPALILWGEHDRFLRREMMEASAALCDDCQCITLEGATHWMHWEDPARVTAEILRFACNA